MKKSPRPTNAPGFRPASHPTQNTLPREAAARSCELLAARLVDSLDLYASLKQAHWNIRGPGFIAMHELFDKVAEASQEWGDVMAERLRQLGAEAIGTPGVVAERTTLPPYPLGVFDIESHVQATSDALSRYTRGCRDATEASSEVGDDFTADLFTQVGREAEKYLWMIESHLG
ncbi:MAG: DNA starvation/stationary phase protection protein Dps [Phycisphaerales bacterium]|nr:DNA starvation/stationary phase protection protein Dps [Phycisphaerales bacterium]